jgi:hypothetical protein
MERFGIIAGRATQTEIAQQELEIVVPFTTPSLTQAALRRAEALGSGLNAHVRLVKLQVVPFPLELDHPPVSVEFLGNQLASMSCQLATVREIYLTRELASALSAALKPNSLAVLTSKWRPWKTRQEKLAAELRRAGHDVLIRYVEAWNV